MIEISNGLIASAVLGLITTGLWYWVRRVDSSVEYIKRNYVRRDDNKSENQRIYDLLREIKSQIEKLDDKLDKKADK